jgi:hypothetical protein
VTWGDLAVRGAGLATHLLDERALAEIEAAAEPAALAAALARAGWGGSAGGDPTAVELGVRLRAGADLQVLARWAGARARALAVLLEDEDRRTLRALVRGLAAATPVTERVAAATPTPTLPLAEIGALAELPTPAALAARLDQLGHPYAADVDAGGPPPADLFAVERALAHRFAARARGRRSHPALATHVSQVIDGDNATAALLLAARGEGVDVDACFLDGGRRLGRADFTAAAGATPERAAALLATRFAGTPLAAALDAPAAGAIEDAVLDWQLASQRRLRREDPIGPAPVILLFLRRRREGRRLRRAAWRLALGGVP